MLAYVNDVGFNCRSQGVPSVIKSLEDDSWTNSKPDKTLLVQSLSLPLPLQVDTSVAEVELRAAVSLCCRG